MSFEYFRLPEGIRYHVLSEDGRTARCSRFLYLRNATEVTHVKPSNAQACTGCFFQTGEERKWARDLQKRYPTH